MLRGIETEMLRDSAAREAEGPRGRGTGRRRGLEAERHRDRVEGTGAEGFRDSG